jgi:hypothetical protein
LAPRVRDALAAIWLGVFIKRKVGSITGNLGAHCTTWN